MSDSATTNSGSAPEFTQAQQIDALSEVFGPEYAAKFQAQESAIARLTAAIENLTKAQTQTLEVIEQFSAIPSVDPVKKPNGISNPQGFTASQMQDRFIENLRKIKQAK